jgi:hypothetical protein
LSLARGQQQSGLGTNEEHLVIDGDQWMSELDCPPSSILVTIGSHWEVRSEAKKK